MGGLSFLKNVTLAANAAVSPTSRTSAAVAKNPENAEIRIYKNGAVFPSAKLVVACDLQYKTKDAEIKGNGFDVFSSKDFLNTKHLAEAFMFIAMLPKNAKFGKVDLFSTTKFNEDGTPKADVLTQGSINLELLEQIKEVYGIEIPEGQNYIDLSIVKDQPFTTDDNIYYVPKKGVRGENKGISELVRRENLTLYALVPTSMMVSGTEEASTSVEEVEEAPEPEYEANSIQEDSGFEKTEAEEGEESFEDTEAPSPEDSDLPPSLEEFEAENDGTVSPAAALPDGVLEDNSETEENSDDDDEFKLEED